MNKQSRYRALALGCLAALALGCDERSASPADQPKSPPPPADVELASLAATQMPRPTPPGCQDPTCAHSLKLNGPIPLQVTPRGGVQPVTTSAHGDVFVAQQALTTNEATINATAGFKMAESASAAMQGSDGTWQTAVFSNVMTNAGSQPRIDYGCVRNSSTLCDFDIGFSGVGSDPSAVAGGSYMYHTRLWGTSPGQAWLRSTNPCPNNYASPSWEGCLAGNPADWTQAVKADNSSVWTVYNDFVTGGDGFNGVTINKLNFCSNVTWWKFSQQCGKVNVNRRNPHGAVGGNGIIHVVWANVSGGQIEYTQFNTNTGLWNCTPTNVAPFAQPPQSCNSDGNNRIFTKLGSLNLEATPAPRIARDPSSGTLVVAWDSYDAGVQKTRGRAFRSTNGGSSWDPGFITAEETAHTTVTVGPGARFEIGDTYNSTENKGAQVSWRSTDGGSVWGGFYISGDRTLAPATPTHPTRPCHWGDYDGVTYNPNQDAYYHSWVDTNIGTDSVIRGRFIANQ